MLTGENGVLTKATEAKEQTEIGTEKEQLSLAITDVRTDGFLSGEGTLNRINLQSSLNKITGQGKTQVSGDGLLTVLFTDSNRSYYVTADGEIMEDVDEIEQSNIYTYTNDGYITGIKEEYLYEEVGKNASLGNIKLANIVPDRYLVDELNGILIIPNEIENIKIIGIEEGAFNNIVNLRQVIISDGIRYIKLEAFSGCDKLDNVKLPNTLETIGGWAFSHCESLKTIHIPESVTRIEDKTFYGCDLLDTIELEAEEGAISGEPWGADGETKIIYNAKIKRFAEEFLSNKTREELEELILKSEMYIGSFEELLEENETLRKNIEGMNSQGMTYEESLKNILILGCSDNWITVEYYISISGLDLNNKTTSELEQIFVEKIGFEGTFDELLKEEGLTRKDFEEDIYSQGYRTLDDYLKMVIAME